MSRDRVKLEYPSIREALIASIRRCLEVSGKLPVSESDKVKGLITRLQALLSVTYNKLDLESKRTLPALKKSLEESIELYDLISKAVEEGGSLEDVGRKLEKLEESVEELLKIHSESKSKLNSLRVKILVSTLLLASTSLYLLAYKSIYSFSASSLFKSIPAVTIASLIGIALVAELQNFKYVNFSLAIILPTCIFSITYSNPLNLPLTQQLIFILSTLSSITTIYYGLMWNLESWTPSVRVELEFTNIKPSKMVEPTMVSEEPPKELVEKVREAYVRRYGEVGVEILKYEIRSLRGEGLSLREAYKEIARRIGLNDQ